MRHIIGKSKDAIEYFQIQLFVRSDAMEVINCLLKYKNKMKFNTIIFANAHIKSIINYAF